MADGKVIIDSKIDDSGITRGLRAIKAKLGGLNTDILKTASLGSAVSLSPSLVPMIASATVATLGLSSSLAAAGMGAVAFGAVAVSALGQVFEAADQVAQLEEKIANADSAKERIAAQKELAALYADMGVAQRFALKELQSFKSFWGDFVKQFEEPIFNAFGTGLHFVQELLKGLAPTIHNVSSVVLELMETLDQDISNGGFAKFFKWLEINAAESLRNFMLIAGNTLSGFFNLMMAFAPIGASMEEGLVGLTKRFKEWASSLASSKAFQEFVDYAMRNGPTVLSVLGNLVSIIVGIGIALSPVGEIALNVLDILTSLLTGDLLGAAQAFSKVFGKEALSAVIGFFDSLKSGIESSQLSLTTIKDFINVFVESTVERFMMFATFVIDAFKLIWTFVEPLVMDMLAFFQEKLQQITQFWQENGEQIMQAVQNAFNFILQIIEFIMPAVMFIITDIWNAIKNVIDGALNMIMGLIKIFAGLFTGDWSKMWEGVKQLLSGAVEAIWGLLQLGFLGKIFNVIKTFGTRAVESFQIMVRGARQWIDDLLTSASSKFSSIGQKIMTPINNAKNKVIGYIEDLYLKALYKWDDLRNAAKTKFDDIKEKIMKPIKEAKEKIKGFIDEIKGFFDNLKLKIPKPQIPKLSVSGSFDLNPAGGMSVPKIGFDGWFASGGVFPANSPRLIGIGDASVPEAALPLKPSVLGMIGQKIADTMNGGGIGGLENLPPFVIQVPIDGKVVAEVTVDPISILMQQKQKQAGRKV
jgi:phage-related protein